MTSTPPPQPSQQSLLAMLLKTFPPAGVILAAIIFVWNSQDITAALLLVVVVMFVVVVPVFFFWFLQQKMRHQKVQDLSAYFENKIPDHTQITTFLYPWGSRKNVPITDLLFMEYIKSLCHEIQQLVIFVSSDEPSSTDYTDEVMNDICQNVKMVFQQSQVQCIVLSPKCFSDITYDEFQSLNPILEYLLERKQCSKDLWDRYRIKTKSVFDYHKLNSDKKKIKSLIDHLYKGWRIIKYIKTSFSADNNATSVPTQVNLASTFLQWNVGRLAMIHNWIQAYNMPIVFFPIVGMPHTVRQSRWNYFAKTPIPGDKQKAICIFDDNDETIKKAYATERCVLKKYNSLLQAIPLPDGEFDKSKMQDNGKKLWEQYKNSHLDVSLTTSKGKNRMCRNINPSPDIYLLLGLISELRAYYQSSPAHHGFVWEYKLS